MKVLNLTPQPQCSPQSCCSQVFRQDDADFVEKLDKIRYRPSPMHSSSCLLPSGHATQMAEGVHM